MKAQEVEIQIWTHDTIIRYRDDVDATHTFWGRMYRSPRPASLNRLARLARALLGWFCEMRIDGMTPYFVFRRPAPLMLPESDR